jgi:predicted acylesterase/phospholipase RssA
MVRNLAIGPGAVGYFTLLGAVNKMWNNGDLTDLESMAGASAGALLCFMLAVTNFDFQSVLHTSLKVPIYKLKPRIKSLIDSYGLVPRETIRELVTDTIKDTIGQSDLTFRQLWERFPKVVYISAHCVELTQTQYFSVLSHPDMSVADALCMSISVPFLFSSFKYNGWHYIDGGSVEGSPCGPFIGQKSEDVLVLLLKYKDKFDVDSLFGYLHMIFCSLCKIRRVYDFPTKYIDVGEADVFEFGCQDTIKQRLFSIGYEQY